MIDVAPERFDQMVTAALDGLPEELGEIMTNVAVTVEHDRGPANLLGLCQGVPLTRRTGSYAGVLPHRITIYRRAICSIRSTESESSSRSARLWSTKSVIASASVTSASASWAGDAAKRVQPAARITISVGSE